MSLTTNKPAEELSGQSAYKDFMDNFQGEIILPRDSDYKEARQVWNALIDRRPVLIARCHRLQATESITICYLAWLSICCPICRRVGIFNAYMDPKAVDALPAVAL